MNKNVALYCKIRRGAFSGEKIIRIKTIEGIYKGASPAGYCWNKNGGVIEEDEPLGDRWIEGMVGGRVLREYNDGSAGVIVADILDVDNIVRVFKSDLYERPFDRYIFK